MVCYSIEVLHLWLSLEAWYNYLPLCSELFFSRGQILPSLMWLVGFNSKCYSLQVWDSAQRTETYLHDVDAGKKFVLFIICAYLFCLLCNCTYSSVYNMH